MNGVKGKKNSSSLSEKKKDKEEGNLFDPQVKTKRLQEITNGELKHRKCLSSSFHLKNCEMLKTTCSSESE